MKGLLKGIQAVTVELLGVLLIVWLLFGFTAMGLHSVSGQPPTFGSGVTHQLSIWKDQLSTRLLQKAPEDENRKRYVANRLGHFSQSYSLAARNHLDQLMTDMDRSTTMSSRHGAAAE